MSLSTMTTSFYKLILPSLFGMKGVCPICISAGSQRPRKPLDVITCQSSHLAGLKSLYNKICYPFMPLYVGLWVLCLLCHRAQLATGEAGLGSLTCRGLMLGHREAPGHGSVVRKHSLRHGTAGVGRLGQGHLVLRLMDIQVPQGTKEDLRMEWGPVAGSGRTRGKRG
jgi:hypothetical protein